MEARKDKARQRNQETACDQVNGSFILILTGSKKNVADR